MAQSAEYLPCKHEDLNLFPSTHKKSEQGGKVASVCNPSTGEAETG